MGEGVCTVRRLSDRDCASVEFLPSLSRRKSSQPSFDSGSLDVTDSFHNGKACLAMSLCLNEITPEFSNTPQSEESEGHNEENIRFLCGLLRDL